MARVTAISESAKTLSTTFNQPDQIARSLGSLDLLSRAGGLGTWFTSATDYEARNCGWMAWPSQDDGDQGRRVCAGCYALWDAGAPTRW